MTGDDPLIQSPPYYDETDAVPLFKSVPFLLSLAAVIVSGVAIVLAIVNLV